MSDRGREWFEAAVIACAALTGLFGLVTLVVLLAGALG